MRPYNVEFGVPEEIQATLDGLLKKTQSPALLILGLLESGHFDQQDLPQVVITRALAQALYTRNAPYDREFSQLLEDFCARLEQQQNLAAL